MSFIRHFRSLSFLCTKEVIAEHSRHCYVAEHSRHCYAATRTMFPRTRARNYTTGEEDESLQENPFYSKYASKIQKLKESGVYEPPKDYYNKALMREAKEWKQKIQKLEKKLTEKKAEENKIAGLKLPGRLDALMRTDLITDASAEVLERVWTKYWSERGTVSAIITAEVFDAMSPLMREFPVFLFPLPREQGYEFFVSQFTDTHCFLTSLLNYQINGEDAPWQICFKMYPELRESHGVVLMASEFDENALNLMEVQFLAQLQQLFYANPTEGRLQLLKNFNQFPDSFKHMDVVKEVESGGMVLKS